MEREAAHLQGLDETLAPLHGYLVEGHGRVLRPPLLHSFPVRDLAKPKKKKRSVANQAGFIDPRSG